MQITFKDVGQGDSIILEWETGGQQKIGIIDCNKKAKANPVLQHLEGRGLCEIEFIILSHPHSDHYSGMIELLEWVHAKGIIVKRFAHTLFILGNDFFRYLNWVEVDTAALDDLQRLIEKVDELKSASIVKKMEFVQERWRLDLDENVYLKCLSPSQSEAQIYMDIVSGQPDKNPKEASRAANYLSTMFCLVDGNSYYLLTADIESTTFQRLLDEKEHGEFAGKSLIVGQLPHHGSSKNYHEDFWSHITTTDIKHAVASAGANEKYKHPHFAVLKNFYENGYSIHCTSLFHGSKEFLEYLVELSQISSKLDTFSILIDSYQAGDKVFPLTSVS